MIYILGQGLPVLGRHDEADELVRIAGARAVNKEKTTLWPATVLSAKLQQARSFG